MQSLRVKKEFRRLYAEFYPVVLSAIYVRTGNVEDAEDICHEVFVRFLNNLEAIEKHREWLMTAVQFEINNYYRKKANQRNGVIDIDVMADDGSLLFENGFRDSRIILQEAIENESNFENERDMILFHLIAVYGYTYREAGEYLGITKWRAEGMYKKTSRRLLGYFRDKGIKGIEDLL